MHKLSFIVLSLLSLSSATAQLAQTPDLPTNRIVVLGDAELELPADQVRVTVTLQYSDPTDARKAFEAHQAAEKRLVKLLKEYQIDEKTIQYTLLQVQKNQNDIYQTGERRTEIVTMQQVIFNLDKPDRYPALQLALINANFNRFAATYHSTKEEQSKNLVLEKAVEVARGKAVILAKAAGRTLGAVLSVRDTEETDPILQGRFVLGATAMAERVQVGYGGSLLDIPQTIRIPARVKVTYELK
ncbi:SIMPL domain-containing protein [Larkinella sp. VNQ87]|uniref:SIMPL domain-containing protein n=1 Tax=Larkinella sp. VNQ87 TaxID=3400921 RepID=UPI003C10033E